MKKSKNWIDIVSQIFGVFIFVLLIVLVVAIPVSLTIFILSLKCVLWLKLLLMGYVLLETISISFFQFSITFLILIGLLSAAGFVLLLGASLIPWLCLLCTLLAFFLGMFFLAWKMLN